MSTPQSTKPHSWHHGKKRWLLLLFFIVNTVVFTRLGIWQVERLAWKKELITKVETRVHKQAAALPMPATWKDLTAQNAEYSRIRLDGIPLYDQEATVYASTELGAGYWVMTPVQVSAAQTPPVMYTVWLNRGFVPLDQRQASARSIQPEPGPISVTGLIRFPEKDNLFLRANALNEDRWYRRVPEELSAARQLRTAETAPFFIDEQASDNSTNAPQWPRAGLTQIQFRNNHMSYAITWFVLALLNLLAAIFLWRSEWLNKRMRFDQENAL